VRAWAAAACGAASGAFLAAAVPGPGLWPLAFCALVPWAVATERAASRVGRIAADYLCGMVFFVPTVWWLSRITLAAFIPVAILAPIFVCFAGWMYRRLRTTLPAALALPAAWTASELVRSLPPFPFPWAWLGYDAAGWLDLAGLASLGGPLLLSFLFAASSGALVDALAGGRKAPRFVPAVAVAVVLAAGVFAGGALRRAVGPVAEGPRIACLQPNIPQSLKDNPVSLEELEGRLFRLARQAATAEPDLVVIPETMLPPWIARDLAPDVNLLPSDEAMPYLVREAQRDERAFLARLRRSLGRKPWLLSGVFLYGPGADPKSARPRNSAILYDANDREAGRYDKMYLVPGSESLPLLPEGGIGDSLRRALDPFTAGMMLDMAPGPGARVLELRREGAERPDRLSPSICYDNAFARPYRDAAIAGCDFHIVLSNEGWFPDSFEMDHMLAYSAFRAIETRRAVVRCTNTGVSCVVGPDGALVEALVKDGRRSEIEGVLSVRPPVPTQAPSTLYALLGDLPWKLLAAVALVGAWALRRRGAKSP